MSRNLVGVIAVLAVCVAISADAEAKYGGFAGEIFFGRQPGAAGAAAGRTGVTSSGDIINTFYNPAGLADAKGLGFAFSWTEDDSPLTGSEDRFMGGNTRIGRFGVVGLSRYHFDYGPVSYADANGGNRHPVTTDASIVVLTLAGEPLKDLLVGANLSAFRYEFTVDRGRTDGVEWAYWADLGLLKYFTLGRTQASGHWLKLGGSLSNFTYSDIDLPDGGAELPVALRLGVAYEMGWWGLTWKRGLRTVETVVQVEYQDVLNSGEQTAVKLGGEIRLVEILALRVGYYRETQGDYMGAGSSDYTEDTTYGFGIYAPFYKFRDGKLPLKLGIDVINIEPPEYEGSGGQERLATVTFSAAYYF
jgi:hypothetical protein